MDKKYKIIGGVCGAICIGGLAAGIFFIRSSGESRQKICLCNECVFYE